MAVVKKQKELLTVRNIRVNNKTNILRQIIKGQDLTRNDLARESNTSLMTVKHIVDDLVEGGLIEECACETSVGRKPKILNMAKKYGNIVCINLTSTQSMNYIIYDLKRNLLHRDQRQFDTKERDYRKKLEELIADIKEKLKEIHTETVGVGILIPSAFYEAEDLTNYDLIPEFKDFHIHRFFKEQFNLKNVVVVHDVFSAAKSEYEAKPVRDNSLFYFYCGFGVGGCLILHGEAVTGENLLAGEVGKIQMHSPYKDEILTLEEIVSIPGILKKVHEVMPGISFEEVLEHYENGTEEIAEVLDKVLNTISRVLYNLLWIYNPTEFVVDSCYKGYRKLIAERVNEYLQRFQMEDIRVTTQVKEAVYEEYHEMRGCFRTTLQKWVDSLAQETALESAGEEKKTSGST